MIYFEELKLHLNDAKMSYEELLAKPSAHWTDWYAAYMVKNGLRADQQELAALLREADIAYRADPEQSSWLNFIAEHVYQKIK